MPGRLAVETPGGRSCPIEIGAGALQRLPDLLGECAPAHQYAIIADSQVARAHGDRVVGLLREAGLTVRLGTFPAGEWNKTREHWSAISDRMLASGFGRDTVVIALGGGVTGDLAGFVAATFLRGVPVVQVPTSLLAMLDSSVGGKTGLDTQAGKNLIGAFHHPAAVLIDPGLIRTLPAPHVRAGLAEAIKMAAIRDEGLWNWIGGAAERVLGADEETLEELIHRAVAHKADVVARDPVESGLRQTLNFGHTVGHALEFIDGYELLHGEAVAAGMRVEARLGELIGITAPGTADRIADLLARCELDGDWEEGRNPTDVIEAARRDKKKRKDRIRFVLLKEIGQTATTPEGGHSFEVEPDQLGAVLSSP